MTLNRLETLTEVVAIGGGHGLGRVMSALSFLEHRLTGIVTTTDNGGSTGRIRASQGGIAWGDIRNCLNQMITTPTPASAMFEYRFTGNGELSGHNLGNLMLKALDNLSVRPLSAINVIRNLLNVKSRLIPMSEFPTDLVAIDEDGQLVYGEVNIDQLQSMPQQLMLSPMIEATEEAICAVRKAELIIIGPGSFMTSLLPPLLLSGLKQAIAENPAPMIFIDNLGKEHSAAGQLSLREKLLMLEDTLNGRRIDAAIVGDNHPYTSSDNTLIVTHPLEADDISYRHDRELLKRALQLTYLQLMTETQSDIIYPISL